MMKKSQKVYLFFKRLIDIFGASLGIILLSPALIIIATTTKLTSRGPVLFRQKRLGKDEKPFVLLKFRSMKVDVPQLGQESMSVDQQKEMTTKWGSFMRKTSLDELPQLFNIFIGNMSFIGPRPGMTKEYSSELVQARESFVPSPYAVKPGLSGLAQLDLRREPDVIQKAKYDSKYVQEFNFLMDAKLFIKSFLVLIGFYKGR